ncbi:hypothetical protein RFI_23816, partial [Reticulomyxa filosa]
MSLKCKDPDNKHVAKSKKKGTTKGAKNKKKKETTEENKEGEEGEEEQGGAEDEQKEGKSWNPKQKKKRTKKQSSYEYVKIKDWKSLNPENEGKELFIPLFLSERCWVYSQQLHDQYDQDHLRKLHHSNNKLRKAI